MIKRITILILLCLLFSGTLTVTAMGYSLDGVVGAPDYSLIDAVPASSAPGPGSFLKLRHPEGTPNQPLLARAAGCSSCEDEDDPNG